METEISSIDTKTITVRRKSRGYIPCERERLWVTRESTTVRISKDRLDNGIVISHAMAEELSKLLAGDGMAVIQDTIREESS